MAKKFAAREVLVLATEDDCSGLSNRNREGIDGAIHAYHEKSRFSTEAWKTSEPLWEKPFEDQDLIASLPEGSLGFPEDELQEEDHLEAILYAKSYTLVASIIIRYYFPPEKMAALIMSLLSEWQF